jgi:hypothetical protein
VNLPPGIEEDGDVLAGLEWLGQVSGDADAFWARLLRAQRSYWSATASPGRLGQDPDLADLGGDVVGSYLAQAKSLLDDRRAFDFALAPRTVPWVKQVGVNVGKLSHVPGAAGRGIRMRGRARASEDTGHSVVGTGSRLPAPAEFKRLRRGTYESREQSRHKALFRRVAALIDERRLSVYIDT